MKLGSAILIVAICIMATVVVQAQDDTAEALCNSQNLLIQVNPGYNMAENNLNQAVINQTMQCYEPDQTTCNVNVDSESQDVADACIAADGVIYTSTLTVTCDNSNTNVVTSFIYQNPVCLGMNCTEDVSETDEQINESAQNATSDLNTALNPLGINCESSYSSESGAVSVIFGGLMVAAMFGSSISMVIAMVLL